MPASPPTPRFYRYGDLPPRAADVDRVRRALQRRGPMDRKSLVEATRLSQSQAMCAVDALIATGDVLYDAEARQFSTVEKR